MRQPVRKTSSVKRIKRATKQPYKRKHKEYGTSRLEERFAKDFLDKLGIEYTYQFKAESIGRYYDFYVPKANCLIEVDGDYFHSYGLQHEQKNPMQKHNEYVDKIKDEWALEHGIPILRIWEHDINNNPLKVMNELKKYIGTSTEKQIIKENKKKRH